MFHPESTEDLAISGGAVASPPCRVRAVLESLCLASLCQPLCVTVPQGPTAALRGLSGQEEQWGGMGYVLLGLGRDWHMWGQRDRWWAAGGTQFRPHHVL